MSAGRLLDHYERIADAPEAIQRLRRFILNLAVRGKLLAQDPGDETASELIRRTQTQRASLEKGRRIRPASLPYGPISVGQDFDLPAAWARSTIAEMCDLKTGATPDRTKPEYFDGDIPWLVSGDIHKGEILECDGRISQRGLDASNCKILPDGSVLIALNGQGRTRATVALLRMKAACNQSLVAITPLLGDCLSAEYLHLNLKSRYQAIRDLTGTDERRGLNMRLISCFEIAIPPLAEQHRIVAKVDELMALCDRLESARAEREATRDRLAASSLARLSSPDPETFRNDAPFVLNALPAITTRPDQIKQIQQTILNMAVRGKLVLQDSDDEPAKDVLARARRAKEAIRRERGIGRNEDPEFSQSEGETISPSHWAWAHLADFALVLGGKRLPAGAEFSPTATEHIYVRVTDMKGGTISTENLKYITPDVQRQIAKYTIDSDDIYITIAGTIGEVGQVPDFFHGHNLTENAAKIVFREVDRAFLTLVLRSEDVQAQFREKTKQMAQPKLALKRILGARVPLPPLAEQHRIVAKVDELTELCDRLEASLTAGEDSRRHLLDALLAEALSPSEPAEMEAVA